MPAPSRIKEAAERREEARVHREREEELKRRARELIAEGVANGMVAERLQRSRGWVSAAVHGRATPPRRKSHE